MIFDRRLAYFISAPFIYVMLFPAVIWHIFLEIYHQICFRLYRIPLVDRRQYFIYERHLLSQLSYLGKINCYYCSYVNNLLAYSSQIAALTERYWCPLKYLQSPPKPHSQYSMFLSGRSRSRLYHHWQKLRCFHK